MPSPAENAATVRRWLNEEEGIAALDALLAQAETAERWEETAKIGWGHRDAAEARLAQAEASAADWERQAKGRGVVQYELLARAEAAEARLAQTEGALRLIPIDEWQEWANRDVLDMIDADLMDAFLKAARVALTGEGTG